jgi:hypothetical protein
MSSGNQAGQIHINLLPLSQLLDIIPDLIYYVKENKLYDGIVYLIVALKNNNTFINFFKLQIFNERI